jgi:predicted permease
VLALFVDNLLPVFLAAGAGYLLAWRLRIDPKPIAQLAFFVLAPCLVFQVMIESDLTGSAVARMIVFTAGGLLTLGALVAGVARALGWARPLIAALVLVVVLPNAGNFGLSVSLFAFGEEGLAHASISFITSAVMTFTVGILVASLGRSGLGATLRGMLRVPAIWALVVAVILVRTDSRLPMALERTVELLSEASIPVFLVVLGMQLHGKGIGGPRGALALGIAFRLVGGALVGLLLAAPLELTGVARQAGVMQVAMPSAVITIVLATEYDVEPALVTSVVVWTTLLSPVTLTPLLAWLGA